MRINFFYTDTKEPVAQQDRFYIGMYGEVYEMIEEEFDALQRVYDVGWEILE